MGIYSECILCEQGDAHMRFLKDNVQSDTDVSVLVRASSAGKKKQMTLADTNLLKLKETEFKEGQLKEFEEMYGTYVVVGYLYAGEILFESKYSASNSEDKNAITGGLSYVITIHSLYSLFSVHIMTVTPSSQCLYVHIQRLVLSGWIPSEWQC